MKEGKAWKCGLIRITQTYLQEIPTDVRNHNNTQQEISETEQGCSSKHGLSGDSDGTDSEAEIQRVLIVFTADAKGQHTCARFHFICNQPKT